MVILLDWITATACFIAVLVLGYAGIVTPRKWLRILLILGILVFLGFLIHGIGALWSDYRIFR